MGRHCRRETIPDEVRRRCSVRWIRRLPESGLQHQTHHSLLLELEHSTADRVRLARIRELPGYSDTARMDRSRGKPGDLYSRQLPGWTVWTHSGRSLLHNDEH